MPHVVIEFMRDTMNEDVAHDLTKTLREVAARLFSVNMHTLETRDFSIIYNELSEWSEPTHDVVVRIQLHNFETRVLNSQRHADEMAEALATTFARWNVEAHLTIGVSLSYGHIAWATSSVDPNYHPDAIDR